MVHCCEQLMGVVVFAKVKLEFSRTRSNNTPAKNSHFFPFELLKCYFG